jgi:hypothetical protein
MSSQPAETFLGLDPGPPVSLPAAEGATETSAEEVVMPVRPPLEAQLVQEGKLSMGQLAQAHRDRLEKGGSVLDIVVERGWVSAEDVAALRAAHGIEAPPPAPVAPTPEPEEPTATETAPPAPEPAPEQPLPPAAAYKIGIRLTNGELIIAGQAQDVAGAEMLAQAVVGDLTTPGESWPRIQGRYLRPELILSVDILPS